MSKGKILVKRSDCCNATATPVSLVFAPGTITHWECTKCRKACGIILEEWIADQGVVDDEAAKDNI